MVIKSTRVSWMGYVVRMREMRNACNTEVGKPDGRPWRRWEDNIKMDRT
jgi:hypothetical protein